MKLKKVLAVSLAAAMTLSLAACGDVYKIQAHSDAAILPAFPPEAHRFPDRSAAGSYPT